MTTLPKDFGSVMHRHPVCWQLCARRIRSRRDCFVKNDRGEVYDRFRHRLMFPIWNERGKTIAFGGRALGDVQPKYLNSAESPLYSKSYVLYALHLARDAAQKAGRMVVVEGYFDCLSLHQNGIENVVASCGTSLTEQQVALDGTLRPRGRHELRPGYGRSERDAPFDRTAAGERTCGFGS